MSVRRRKKSKDKKEVERQNAREHTSTSTIVNSNQIPKKSPQVEAIITESSSEESLYNDSDHDDYDGNSDYDNTGTTTATPVTTTDDELLERKEKKKTKEKFELEKQAWMLHTNIPFFFEVWCKIVFFKAPKIMIDKIPWLNMLASLFCLYNGFQTLGLLWAFLANILGSLGLKFGYMVAKGQVPESNIFEVGATCYAVYTTLVVLIGFGMQLWTMSWHSVYDFPIQRKIILLDRHSRAVMFLAMFGLFFWNFILASVPYVCEDITKKNSKFCQESIFRFLASEDFKTQRALKLTIIVGLVQWIQMLLYQVPNWHVALLNRRKGAFFLSAPLAVLLCFTGIWFVEWTMSTLGLPFHIYHELFGEKSDLTTVELGERQLALRLLLCWELWFLFFTILIDWPAKLPHYNQDKRVRKVFQHMKLSFLVIGVGQFMRSCLHVNSGFLVAQGELALYCLVVPLTYTVIYASSVIVMRLSWTTMIAVSPIAVLLSLAVFQLSHISGQASVVMVFLHLLTKCSRYFGNTLSFKSKYKRRIQSQSKRSRSSLEIDNVLSENEVIVRNTSQEILSQVIRFSVAIIIILCISMSIFSSLSVIQDMHGWIPSTSSFRIDDERNIYIEHASIVDLVLKKRSVKTKEFEENLFRDAQDIHYAVCESKIHGLSIIDYAILSQLAYFEPQTKDFKVIFREFFEGDKPENTFEIRLPEKQYRRSGHAQFYEAYNEALNMSVIAIRGTDVGRIADFIEDVKMYMEPVIVTILSYLFPTIRIWPDRTTSFFIEALHELLALFGLEDEDWYFNTITDYIHNITDRRVAVTGHSLGGGLARIAGLLTKHFSVSFSAPGIAHNFQKILKLRGATKGFDYGSVHHKSINIVPVNDLVPMVDSQAGLVQTIMCQSEHKSLQNSCHMMESTLCELITQCGDYRFENCSFDYHLSGLIKTVVLKIYEISQSISWFLILGVVCVIVDRFLALP